uniref:Uncharacterized protein n=1 Tax=Panagrolaimus superbus TaxID=310955 RepID=A0A914YAN1_9BILA
MVTQKRFAEKVVIVTGSSAGIGKSTILHFAKEGASVILHGQSKEKLEKVKAELLEIVGRDESKILVIPGSLEDETTLVRLIDETIKQFGKIDILINNAGIAGGKPGADFNALETYDTIMAVNVRAIYRLIQLATPHLEKTKGSIVNITSPLGETPFILSMPYSISKAALNHLTRNFARSLAEKGIRVNAVGVGLTRTDLQTRMGLPTEMLDNIFAQGAKHIPLGRISEIDEQAEIILNIASPTNTYMTGSIIYNDGGYLIGN